MEEILIIICLILLNGVFSMSEIALISARKSSLQADADNGLRSARYALKLAKEPDRFLSTVQIGITLIGILTGIYSGNKVAELFSAWLAGMGLATHYASMLSQTIIVVVVTYLTLILGELVPKRIGLTVAEKAAKGVAMPMYALSTIAYPFVWFLSKSTSLIFNLTGLKDKESKVTEEEIKSIIREGAEDGEVQPVEQDIMRRVFLVGDLEVDAIMTHRSELTWLDCNMTAEQVKDIIKENMYAVYPVAEGDLDHVKGVVTIKDLFLALGEKDFDLHKIMQEPTYFYENTDVYKVLENMKSSHISTGLVCDEYGSCIGIITLKDILESIVGTVPEPVEEEPYIIPRKEGEEWFVDGQCPMYDFLSYFGKEDLLDDEDYNTVGGLCLYKLDHVPGCGETFVWENFKFEVIDMDGARIDKLLVSREKEEEKPAEE